MPAPEPSGRSGATNRGSGQVSGISRTVFVLGAVSLLTDISSEGIFPLIPLFLTEVLRAEVLAVGLIEGVANSTASILRVFSGWLSDVLGNRKWLVVGGYSLSTVSKPMFAAAGSWQAVFGIRFADRLGKGIRTAPRDALIADVSAEGRRGVSFGFHRAMDTVGAIAGPLIAFWLLRTVVTDYRVIFLLSAIPAAAAVLILVFFIHEPRPERPGVVERPFVRLSGLGRPFKLFLLVTTLFSLGKFSEVFLILRARDIGIGAGTVLLTYVVLRSVEAALSVWAGALSDRVGRRNVMLAGYLVFAGVYSGFGLAHSTMTVWVLFASYGLYSALTQGVQKAFAADLISAGMRGTGLGAYHTLTGLALLPASLIAGYLWDAINPAAPFFFGAAMALLAAFLLATFFRGSSTYTAM